MLSSIFIRKAYGHSTLPGTGANDGATQNRPEANTRHVSEEMQTIGASKHNFDVPGALPCNVSHETLQVVKPNDYYGIITATGMQDVLLHIPGCCPMAPLVPWKADELHIKAYQTVGLCCHAAMFSFGSRPLRKGHWTLAGSKEWRRCNGD